MANYVATQATLYQAGGSGDNLIPDGYVKAVEKIWLDSFTWGLTTSPSTGDTILIGYIPANKKIVGCEVYFPVAFAPATCLFNVGPSYSTSLLISSAAISFSAPTAGTISYYSIKLNNPAGMGFVVTSATTTTSGSTQVFTNVMTPIYLSFTGVALTAPTIGTITTLLRYT